MDIEGSPGTVIAIPTRFVDVSLVYHVIQLWFGWLWWETTHHFPLGGTRIGAAVLSVVLDMTLRARLRSRCIY